MFESTIDLADELYITQLDGDWHCTKFFPEFRDKFELKSALSPQTENGITFRFTTWKRLQKQTREVALYLQQIVYPLTTSSS